MPDKLSITFVIGGDDVVVEANENEPLLAARNKALADSKNTGRPPDDWEVRDEGGSLLDVHKKLGELGLAPGAKLYLQLKVGAGG